MAPPLPPTPTPVLAIRLGWFIGADLTSGSTIHFAYSGAPASVAACTAIAVHVSTEAFDDVQELLGADNGLTGVEVTDLSVASGSRGENLFSVTGTLGGGPISAATAFLINYQVSRRYRGGKPRTYAPFGTATSVSTPDVWTSAFVDTVTTGWNAFIAAISGFAADSVTIDEQVSVSYFEGFTEVPYGTPTKYRRTPTPRAVPVVDPILSTSYNPRLSNQRRRLGKR